MWLPKPVYERIPQFYFLVGLLFMANGLYLGFEYVLSFYYIAFGLISCCYGVGIFLMRMQNRQAQPAMQSAEPVADVPVIEEQSSESAEESVTVTSHESPTQH